MARIKVSSAKAKGRNFQKYIASLISELTGIPHGKDEDIESRPMGQSGTDIILRGDALKRFPFSIECKAQESWSVPSWIKQAKANRKDGTDWVLFAKRSREEPVVIMGVSTFFNIMEKSNG